MKCILARRAIVSTPSKSKNNDSINEYRSYSVIKDDEISTASLLNEPLYNVSPDMIEDNTNKKSGVMEFLKKAPFVKSLISFFKK